MPTADDTNAREPAGDATATTTARALLVFADDWGRHPSSCQHLISKLLSKYQVAWVNTIGMRPPRLDHVTFKRAWEKLTPWAKPRRSMPTNAENPRVIDPKMWPWFSRSHDRWLNQKMLSRGLRPVVKSLDKPVVGVTTLPIVADLMGQIEVDRWVYYCVDDFSKWPGLDHQALAEMETALVQKADLVIAASPHLQKRLQQLGRGNVELLTHGVDLEHWKAPLATDTKLPQAFNDSRNENRDKDHRDKENSAVPWLNLPQPLVVFWGLIDRRMDPLTLRMLSQTMRHGTILLVGPLEQPDPSILALPRVKHLPALDYDQLPNLAAAADVLIMPYANLPVTRAMQPLKLKEYLCTDKPVVVQHLPAVQPWLDCLDAADSPEQFAARVLYRLEHGLDTKQSQARQRIQQETWESKAARFEAWALTSQAKSQT